MGLTLTDILLFGKATAESVDDVSLAIYRGNIMRWSTIGGYLDIIVKGVAPLSLPDAIADSLSYVKAFGGTEQNGTPTPDAPMDIVSNNGVLKLSPNLFKSSDITTTTVSDVTISVDSDGVITADGTSSSPNYSQFVFPLSNPISEGTYTVSLYNSEALAAGSLVGFAINTTVGTRGTSLSTVNTVKTITIGSGEVCNNVIIRIAGTANQFKFKIQIEKGDQGTTYRPYGQIYTDGTVETINVHGKNLFNILTDDTGQGWYIEGTTVANSTANGTIVINCKPNTKYSFWHTEGSGGCRAFTINKDTIAAGDTGVWATQAASPTTNANTVITTYTTPADAKKLYILGYRTGLSGRSKADQLADLMVVEGEVATATAYQPYFDGGTATAEMLLKVGDYQDVQSIIDGVVTRNVGVKVLDGTESWVRTEPSSSVPFATFNLALSTTAVGGISNVPRCSHFVSATSTGRSSIPDNGVGVTANSTYTTMWFRCDSITITNDFTAWLAAQYNAGTPVIILFALATPTTESVAGQTLQVTDGDNTLEITQASLDGLELEAKYKAAVTLTIQEVQDANLDPNVEVTIN